MWSYNNRNNNSRAPLCPHEGLHYPVPTPSVEPYTALRPTPTQPQLPYGLLSQCWAAALSPRNTATATVAQTLTIAHAAPLRRRSAAAPAAPAPRPVPPPPAIIPTAPNPPQQPPVTRRAAHRREYGVSARRAAHALTLTLSGDARRAAHHCEERALPLLLELGAAVLADPLERVVGPALHLGEPRALQLRILYDHRRWNRRPESRRHGSSTYKAVAMPLGAPWSGLSPHTRVLSCAQSNKTLGTRAGALGRAGAKITSLC